MIAALLCGVAWFPAQPLAAQVPRPQSVETIGVLRTPITESSGVAVSRQHPGILWTHNDSGDGPFLYAVTMDGTLLARFEVRNAAAVDWEDVALGPCPRSDDPCLYVGDTGDNLQQRRSVHIYVVPEPRTLSTDAPGDRILEARDIRLRYEDGRHDVEALAITSKGDLLLATKGRTGPITLYRVMRDDLEAHSLRLAPWLTLDAAHQRAVGRQVTGAAVSPDGRHLVIRTYAEILFFALDRDGATPLGGCWLGGWEQGEAVDFLDDSTLVLTSESAFGRHGRISKVRCTP
jgi:hypothetical protein